jgi:hypothetical protein
LVAGIVFGLGHDLTGKLELKGPYSSVVILEILNRIPESTHDALVPPIASA